MQWSNQIKDSAKHQNKSSCAYTTAHPKPGDLSHDQMVAQIQVLKTLWNNIHVARLLAKSVQIAFIATIFSLSLELSSHAGLYIR